MAKIETMLHKMTVLGCMLWLLAGHAGAQVSLNMIQLSNWDDDSLPTASPGNLNLQYSGCWGLAVNDHEFAVLGGAGHILFFDITVPESPALIGKFAGSANTIWREFKSYKNRIYGVSDNTSEGLMIFDMSQAPDTIVRTYWSNELFNKAHTITLDTSSGRIYLNGSNEANQGLLILDISQDPDQPTLLAAVNVPGGYIHDSYVRGDTIYASSGNDGYIVLDCTDPLSPQLLASVSTGGYNHNSWLSTDGRYAYYTEEIPRGRPWRIVDLQHLADGEIEIVGSVLDGLLPGGDTLAIPHNIYIRDNLLFNSQYEDGLLVYDITDPVAPVLVGYYDTHPQNTVYNGYYGNWGNYPWLPSGNIIAGDMQNGLFVLRLDSASAAQEPETPSPVTVMPNPAADQTRIRWPEASAPSNWEWQLIGSDGRILAQEHKLNSATAIVSLRQLPAGIYVIRIRTENGQVISRKVVRR
jgi:choice-of-anchor B domain-containing protein